MAQTTFTPAEIQAVLETCGTTDTAAIAQGLALLQRLKAAQGAAQQPSAPLIVAAKPMAPPPGVSALLTHTPPPTPVVAPPAVAAAPEARPHKATANQLAGEGLYHRKMEVLRYIGTFELSLVELEERLGCPARFVQQGIQALREDGFQVEESLRDNQTTYRIRYAAGEAMPAGYIYHNYRTTPLKAEQLATLTDALLTARWTGTELAAYMDMPEHSVRRAMDYLYQTKVVTLYRSLDNPPVRNPARKDAMAVGRAAVQWFARKDLILKKVPQPPAARDIFPDIQKRVEEAIAQGIIVPKKVSNTKK